MAKLVVMSNPVDGKEEAYNAWYDNVHIPELLTIPGIKSAKRFKQKSGADTWSYLCIYEVEGDDPEAVLAEMRRRVGGGETTPTDAINMATGYVSLFVDR